MTIKSRKAGADTVFVWEFDGHICWVCQRALTYDSFPEQSNCSIAAWVCFTCQQK